MPGSARCLCTEDGTLPVGVARQLLGDPTLLSLAKALAYQKKSMATGHLEPNLLEVGNGQSVEKIPVTLRRLN